MNKAKNTAFTLVLALAAVSAGAQVPVSIPSSAPFYTDVPNEYVADQTAQGIGSLNMVLCVIGGLDTGDMVNAGPYVALVNMVPCQAKGGGGGSNSAGATQVATAVVQVTRVDANSPMVGKVWMSFTESGATKSVLAYLSATQAPSASSPYGVFRLDYVGKDGSTGAIGFNGFIDAKPGSISFFETGPNSGNTALALATQSTSAGAGSMNVGGTAFDFAYDTGHFRRSDGTADQCFDRTRANAGRSVWRYGTYSAVDGTRVDMAHPGFPIQATWQAKSYFGFANYWGINFQGIDLNTIPDANPVPGLVVTDQRPKNTSTYTLSKVGGKLTKWTQVQTTLGAIDGIPFTFGADLTGQTSNNAVTGWNNWIAVWNSAAASLTVTGQQNCGPNGCLASALAGNATATVNASFFATMPLSGWSDSFGGNINIPAVGGAHAAGDAVFYFSQSTVTPGSAGAPSTLYCLAQCPTAASIVAFSAGNSATSPFGNNTAQQWFDAPAANTVTYAFGATGLAESGVPIVLEQASQIPAGSQFAQGGIMTGRLFDTALTSSACPPGAPQGAACVQEPASAGHYFTWSTGSNQWNQSLWLTNAATSQVVAFDAPQNIPYTVPSGAAYGSWAGKSILLQFNGFGNLFGIPGSCVDASTNATVDCSAPGSRYVAQFAIPENDTSMSLPGSPSTPLIVKSLDAELRLANLGASLPSSPCASMALTPQTLPSGGTHDPSSASDSEYLGVQPVVTANPKVVDGVLQ
jgi:hypothetical protein